MEETDLIIAFLTGLLVIVPALLIFIWGLFSSFAKKTPNTIDDKAVQLVDDLKLVEKAKNKVVDIIEKKIESKKAKK
jgi:hypothetical protein